MPIFQSVIGKSEKLLFWTHYYIPTQELNPEALRRTLDLGPQ